MKESIKMPRLLKEDHSKECSDEVSMAKIQLKSIMDDAGSILQGLDQCENLDAWIQSKLALAEDYLTTVAKYLKFEEEQPAEELPLVPATDEAPPALPDMSVPLDGAPEEADLAMFSQPVEEIDPADELSLGDLEDDEDGEDVEVDVIDVDDEDGEDVEVDVDDEMNESNYLMPRMNEQWDQDKLDSLLRDLRADGLEMGDDEAFDIAGFVLSDEPGLEDFIRNSQGVSDPLGWLADRI